MGTLPLCGSDSYSVAPLETRGAPVGASNSTVNKDVRGGVKKEVGSSAPSPSKRMRLKIGSEILKNYEPKALIGKGSFSKVVMVEHRETKSKYALKVVDRKHTAEHNVETELNILKRIEHPHVVRLYETLSTEEQVYMVLELAEGGELYNRINLHGPLGEPKARDTVRMILEGLDYLHRCGVTHRDLKLENLLYKTADKDSSLLISDFGLAHHCQDPAVDVMTTTCGTSEYLAPEVLEGDFYSDAVDMWAVGVITFVVLSGEMPFEQENKSKLYHAIMRGEYSFHSKKWSGITGTAKTFISELLQVDPHHRMSAATALRHKWITTTIMGEK